MTEAYPKLTKRALLTCFAHRFCSWLVLTALEGERRMQDGKRRRHNMEIAMQRVFCFEEVQSRRFLLCRLLDQLQTEIQPRSKRTNAE